MNTLQKSIWLEMVMAVRNLILIGESPFMTFCLVYILKSFLTYTALMDFPKEFLHILCDFSFADWKNKLQM